MGNFHTNITLRHADASAADVLGTLGRSAYVAPAMHDTVVVFDQVTEQQDPDELARLAAMLSERLGCVALGVLNHDDDVLRYTLHEPGRAPDAYDSPPGYFNGSGEAPSGGDVERLRAAFGRGEHAALERVLHGTDAPSMAIERHEALVQLLGLHPAALGMGYTYLERGESREGLDADALIVVAPRPQSRGPEHSQSAEAASSGQVGDGQRRRTKDLASALDRPASLSPELLAIIGDVAPTESDIQWTLKMALAYTVVYLRRSGSGRLMGEGATLEGVVFDERLAALFGVPQATMVEMLRLVRRHVTEL